eukprot:2755133-Amphidinium_carterae.2
MASLVTQAQQQQQQLLQEVQNVVQQNLRIRTGRRVLPCPTSALTRFRGALHQLARLDVASDGRCLYRSLATVLRTTWSEEYAVIQRALESPSQQLLDAWYDLSPPQEEARRLTDRCLDRALPECSWPGAQAIFAWAIARQANITVCTTTRASLEYSYGPDDKQRVFLAYNGSHYRPFQLHTETELDYAASRQ